MRRRRQLDELARPLHRDAPQVGERATLRVLGIGEERRRGGMRRGQVGSAERHEGGDAQLRAKLSLAEGTVELPGRPMRDGRAGEVGDRTGQVALDDDFRRREAREPAGELVVAAFRQADLALRKRRPREAEPIAHARDREQHRVAPVGEEIAVGERARRDDADDLALDRALARTDCADLLADRNRLAHTDEPGQIGVDRVHRHSGHGDRRAGAGAARGQGDVEELVGALRVVEEELVEVAHPVEEERLGMIGLDAQVLRHHGRVRGKRGTPGCCIRHVIPTVSC